MNIVHFQRRPHPNQYSVEGYFARIRMRFEQCSEFADLQVLLHVVRRRSTGITNRLINTFDAWLNERELNHVTGDIHYVTLFLNKKRTVLTILDCEILERLSGWRKTFVQLFWYTLPSRRVSAITVISHETKQQLLKHIAFPPERIFVIPVSISPIFQPTPKTFDHACPQILQIGTKPNKNVPRLIEALEGINSHVHIVGPIDSNLGDLLQRTKTKYTNYNNLTDNEMVGLYNTADIVSLISTCEGFGMPILEAQTIERVCITSNLSSMPEVAGDGACLVDPYDTASIRRGFIEIIDSPAYRTSLIENGRRNRSRFSEIQIARQYAFLYNSIYHS